MKLSQIGVFFTITAKLPITGYGFTEPLIGLLLVSQVSLAVTGGFVYGEDVKKGKRGRACISNSCIHRLPIDQNGSDMNLGHTFVFRCNIVSKDMSGI